MLSGDMVGFGDCTWAFPAGIEIDSGTNALRVDKTNMRFVNVNIVVNLGSSAYAAGGVVVELPYSLGIGRDGKTGACDYYMVSGSGSFSAETDEAHNKIILKNNAVISAGQHNSLSVTYRVDCWYITSGKPFSAWYTVNGVSGALPEASILTDSDMNLPSFYQYWVDFVGVESGELYAQSYNPAFEHVFGLSREEWDENYVYDVMSVCVQPKGQQAYDIGIEFVPGRYSTQTGNDLRPYGWDGELIGAMCRAYNSTNAVKIDVPLHDTVAYDDLPNHDTRPEHQVNIDRAREHTWRSYKMSVSTDELGIISDLADSPGSDDAYSLYFLVRYPKPVNGAGSIVYQGNNEQSGFIILNGSVQITHTLLDSGKEVSGFKQSQLYLDMEDGVDYSGNVYSAGYVEAACTAESTSGLTALSKGRTSSLKLTGDWFCLNENRLNGNAVSDGYMPWELNAIVDTVLLSHTGSNGASAIRLGSGDYRIARYGITVVDDFGASSMNDDGDWWISWGEISKQSVINRGDGDAPVYVYGSESLFDDDWELVETFALKDIYAVDSYRSVRDHDKHLIPSGKNYVRLKVSYPDSKLTTAIRIGYDVELMPDGANVGTAVDTATDGLIVTSWLGYTAYGKGSQVPDLQTDRDAISGDTAVVVRADDARHPYPGYDSSIYPYRDVFQSKLLHSTDDVGMTITQGLFDAKGNLMGDPYTETTVTGGNGLSKVFYRIHGFVTNYSSDATEMSGILEQRNLDLADNVESAYTSTNQRYYVLLPAGLEYEEDSLKLDARVPGPWSWISGITTLKVGMTGSGGTGITADWWQNGRFWSDTKLTAKWVGNRQLLIIDRDMSRNVVDGAPVWLQASLTPGNWSHETKAALWGHGLSFNAVPRKDADGNTIGLPAGSYEALVAHQFLSGKPSQGPVHAIDLDAYGGDTYSSAEEAFGSAGSLIDDYVIDSGSRNLTAISSVFRHTSGIGGSMAGVQVAPGEPGPDASYGDAAHIEIVNGTYHYALTYEAMDGLSSDVVLWDSIEDYDRNGVSSQWRGVPVGVDIHDTGAKVYVHGEAMDLSVYVGGSDGRGCEYLTDPNSGWALADDSTDWSKVKSVAFWFDGTVFDSMGEKGPQSATVYLKMKAPLFVTGAGTMTAYNEILFSDVHEQTNVRGTVLANSVSVNLEVTEVGSFELPNTGGSGIALHIASGCAIALFSGLALLHKKQRGR